jgi:hypothetical protein
MDVGTESETWRLHKKHVFALSGAGKPIYTRYGNEDKVNSMIRGQCLEIILLIDSNRNHKIRPEGGQPPGGR